MNTLKKLRLGRSNVICAAHKGGAGKTLLALSLFDALKCRGIDVGLVEHDLQGTIAQADMLGGRHKLDEPSSVRDLKVHDLPPYPSPSSIYLFEQARKNSEKTTILIPLKASDNDLFSLNSLVELIDNHELLSRAVVVFNEVRQPHTKIFKQIKQNLKMNFPELRVARTELSNLVGFRKVLREPLTTKAAAQISSLLDEVVPLGK